MSFTIPDGYLDGPRAAAAAYRFCTTAGERCPAPLRAGIDGNAKHWGITVFARWIVSELANERFPAFGIRTTDGNLVTLEAGLWRKPLFIAAEAGYGGGTGAIKDPGLAFVGGKTFDLPRPRLSVLPVVAEHDLLEALGAEDLPRRPAILPADAPDAPRPPTDKAEAARWWLRGFADGVAAPQKLNRNIAAQLCQDATECTVDEGRAAYSALPVELRNPTPMERNARRNPIKS